MSEIRDGISLYDDVIVVPIGRFGRVVGYDEARFQVILAGDPEDEPEWFFDGAVRLDRKWQP